MTESVTDIIVARERRQQPMTRYVVMSLVGHAVEPPPALAACLARPAASEPLGNDYDALRAILAP